MKTNTYLLAIDQGTTGSTVLVVDVTGGDKAAVIGRHTQDFPQHYPETGWVEHDLEEIWFSVSQAVRQALAQAKIDPKQIAAIGVTNQRETLCVFDRKTGKPVHRAIVWQDKRSAGICARLKGEGHEARVG
jgi:glycerol kinase